MKTLLKITAVALTALGLSTGSAFATAILTFTNGSNTVTVQDNIAPDNNSTFGIVAWNGTVGDWALSSGVGETQPFLGTTSIPNMDLNYGGTTSVANSTLEIDFSATGFTYTGGLSDLFSGTNRSYGSVVDNVWATDAAGKGIFTYQLGPDASSLISLSGVTPVITLASTDVLHIAVTMTSASNTSASHQTVITGDKHVMAVPDSGTTALLLGLGLLGMGLAARRLKSVKA